MKEIGDHLGHRKPDSTRVYAKVDLAGFREVPQDTNGRWGLIPPTSTLKPIWR
jgi:hypothetical protein